MPPRAASCSRERWKAPPPPRRGDGTPHRSGWVAVCSAPDSVFRSVSFRGREDLPGSAQITAKASSGVNLDPLALATP